MNCKTYTIIKQNKSTKKAITTECSCYSLHNVLDNFINEKDNYLFIFSNTPQQIKEKKEIKKSDIKKSYNSKYAKIRKAYREEKIDKSEFDEIIIDLKRMKE